jgi:hypothetical protein
MILRNNAKNTPLFSQKVFTGVPLQQGGTITGGIGEELFDHLIPKKT